MKRIADYPITVSQAKDHPETINDIFLKKKRHSFGHYLGVCLLQGIGLGEDAEKIRSSVAFGDELVLKPDVNPSMPISVFTKDGMQVGFLTYTDSLFPMMLINRGLELKCFVEALEYSAGVLSIAVSLYFQRY